jgi:iron complex transport system substrate-binding protein
MTRLDAHNAVALIAALATSLLPAVPLRDRSAASVEQIAPRAEALTELALPGGARGIRDASSAIAPLRRYQRIASASLIADHVLWELCEPERVVAVTQGSKHDPRYGYRYQQRAGIESPADLEPILALHPDLLLVNHFADPRYAERLREHGIVVFDLGEMHGLSTLLPSIRVIGKLVGAEQRADELAQHFVQRLDAIARDVPTASRPRALYLAAYGKQLFGGAAGTSYHDVLTYAGLLDVAAPAYSGWPALDAEQVLSMDPEVVVTRKGMTQLLCNAPGLSRLRPCRGEGRFAELDPDLADDPGLPMLELAESLHAQVHGAGKH